MTFALLDDANATRERPTSRLCTGFAHEHRCDDPSSLDAVCDAAEADLRRGLHAVLLADYEWGARLLGAGHERIAPHDAGALRLLMFERCERLARDEVNTWLAAQDDGAVEPSPAGFANLRASIDRARFEAGIARIHELIAAGETYQVNFTYRLFFESFGAPAALYRRLRARQPVPFGAFVALPDGGHLLSCSPELFVRHDGGRIAARPMKGTARRVQVPEGDSATAHWLANDLKNRAENLMIVDLLRNDLGRVATTGSVRVPALFALEPYRTVLQMTSTIEAELPRERRFAEVLRALYPCGSITGAPKHHTMQLIAGLESPPRGLYTGAIGWLDAPADGARACGDFCLSVAIRTLEVAPDGHGRLGVGAGIVADSIAAAEWDECALKARFATALDPGITLFETLLAQGGRVPLLDAHLDRLRRSADALGFAFARDAAATQVLAAAAVVSSSGPHRLRANLAHDGRLVVQSAPLAPLATPVRLRLADAPLPPLEARLAGHKTSLRATYDEAVRTAEREGVFDLLFRDADGHITEGARSNLFARLGGHWCTPPLAAGVLPGVMRAQLLGDPAWNAVERPLTFEDLRRADALVVCNALRGALPAWLVD
jgi:para-aminobenzoate synthetase/4-amino-4-deoxychorismate lyase